MVSKSTSNRKSFAAAQLPENPLRNQLFSTLAVDTEYYGTHTLTVQVATRLDSKRLAVQIYHSPMIPPLPRGLDLEKYLPLTDDRYGQFFRTITIRPNLPLSSDLSPTRLMRDATAQDNLRILSLAEGRTFVDGLDTASSIPMGVKKNNGLWQIPDHSLTLVGHFLTADLFRIFGREFWTGLHELNRISKDGIVVRSRRLLQFLKNGCRRSDPILEYFFRDPMFFATRVTTRDTSLPFGPGSLDSHSRTFLGLPKCQSLSEKDKRNMLKTFQEKTEDAYGYAIVDAVNTLLIFEEMQRRDREIFRNFDINGIPPMRPTLGSRVSTFFQLTTEEITVIDSESLSKSKRALSALMECGGVQLFFGCPSASRYGTQTGRVHGGLLYSRSPTRFWHEAPGMLRDVDMSGCYQKVIADKSVYWGRPVIFEPGSATISLRNAVEMVRRNADDDAWLIRVTGKISAAPNALIPSTEDALTSANYQMKLRKGKRRSVNRYAFHLEALRDPSAIKGTIGSRLYAAVVESGIVTTATWEMIQVLPKPVRDEYEALSADSIIFYPRKLVATSGGEFDSLIRQYRRVKLPWSATLDLEGMQISQKEKLDENYVTVKHPIGAFAEKIGELRAEARLRDGKGSGADVAWKMHANTMYGVLACAYFPTNNFVAANIITAQARAEAFALSQALNAIQTITDGCTYRLDQIPACTWEECLRIKPNYPICRAEECDGIPFIDPSTIPQGNAEFTAWYREHVTRFFRAGNTEFDKLIATHSLEHKQTRKTESVAFDALACDGSANYAKCTLDDAGEMHVEDFAARSYGRKSKARLAKWMVATYSNDLLEELAPVTIEAELLKFRVAGQRARRALSDGVPEVVFPLGLEHTKVLSYRVIKASSFIFETPEQRLKVVKQIQAFEQERGAGLEVLCLRRTYAGRTSGSLEDLARAIHDMIRDGRTNLKQSLNLRRLSENISTICKQRLRRIATHNRWAAENLRSRIDTRNVQHETLIMSLLVRPEDLRPIEQSSSLLDET
jgi:hypothetical protein